MVDATVELFYDNVWNNITADVYTREPLAISRGRADEASQFEPSTCRLTLNNRSGKYSPRNPGSPLFGKIGRNTPVRVKVGTVARFAGEISSWPLRWTQGATDVWVPVEAAGIRRRLNQGTQPEQSALRRHLGTSADVVAYWPMEDEKDASSFASGLLQQPPASIRERVGLAEYDEQAGSAPLPLFKADGGFGAPVDEYTPANRQRFVAFMHAPTAFGSEQRLFRLYTSGPTVDSVALRLNGAGNFELEFHFPEDAISTWAVFTEAGVFGRRILLWVDLVQNTGSFAEDIEWSVGLTFLDDRATRFASNIELGREFGRFTRIYGPRIGDNLKDTTLGHATILNSNIAPAYADMVKAANAWAGEPAGGAFTGEVAADRIVRLANSEGIPITTDAGDSELLGPQPVATLTDILDEAAETDLGILSDQLATVGLHYRPRVTLYNQAPKLALDYALRRVQPPLEPTDDDQQVRNDVTAKRSIGSSARVVKTDGPLSILPPPDGVGPYQVLVEVNTSDDARLPHQAAWRLHMGTVDQLRFPVVTVNLIHPAMASLISNLLTTNPSFEKPLNPGVDWTIVGDLAAERTVGDAVDGNWYATLFWETTGSGNATLFSEWVRVDAGSVYSFSGSVRWGAGTPKDVRHDIQWSGDGGGTILSTINGTPVATTADWKPIDHEGVPAPEGATHARIRHVALATVNTDRWDVDAFFIQQAATIDTGNPVLKVEEGDSIRILGLPSFVFAELNPVDLIVQGWTEEITATEHTVTFNCTPAEPWKVAIANDRLLARADTAGSELASAINATQTTFNVSTTAGPVWVQGSTTPVMGFQILVGGELMDVSAISGTGTVNDPQIFTVARSVNGVVLSHPAGMPVRIANQVAVAAL